MGARPMTFRGERVAPDGAFVYHDADHRIVAVIGPAGVILARYRRSYRDFDLYRAVAPAEPLVALIRFDLGAAALDGLRVDARLPPCARWLPLTLGALEALAERGNLVAAGVDR